MSTGRNLSIGISLILLVWTLEAQHETVLTSHSMPLDDQRYEGVLGSPFWPSDLLTAIVIDQNGKPIELSKIRCNAYEKQIELINNDRYIVLDEKWHKKVAISRTQNTEALAKFEIEDFSFIAGLHPQFENRMVGLMFDGNQIKLINDYTIKISTKVIQDVGQTREVNRFVGHDEYYLLQNGKLDRIRMKADDLIGVLGHGAELKAFMKQKKIKKIKSPADLMKLMGFYDSIVADN